VGFALSVEVLCRQMEDTNGLKDSSCRGERP
jgi:hypothetical protein